MFRDFSKTGTESPGQLRGSGCIFLRGTPTLPAQLHAKGLRWKGYMGEMGTTCRHPAVGAADDTQSAKVGDQYATRHNPLVYFHSIIDRPAYCKANVLPMWRLRRDLKAVNTTRSLSYLAPDLSEPYDVPSPRIVTGRV